MIKLFKNKNNKACPAKLWRSRGFTLVETLVAIAIFTTSIIALMAVLASGISNTTYAKMKMTATYLAQEGIEYVRNARDNDVLFNGGLWSDFTDSIASCMGDNGCSFDDTQPSNFLFSECPTGPNACSLYYDSSTGKYSYDSGSGDNSGFSREIKMIPVDNNPREIQVASIVSWAQGSGKYSIRFSENLFDWTGPAPVSSR